MELYVLVGVLILTFVYFNSKLRPSKNQTTVIPKVPVVKPAPSNFVHVPKEIQTDETPDQLETDVIIVGAGVAGASLAKALGDQGRKVLLIERSITEPDRIVGELLQPGGVQRLRQLGLESSIEGIDAQPEYGYGVFLNGQDPVKLTFPREKDGTPAQGVSFHYGRFVQNLRVAARAQKNVTFVSGTVNSILKEGDRVIGATYKCGETLKTAKAPLTVVVDGCFSNFRKDLCESPTPFGVSSFYGLILNTKLPFPNHGHVILANPGPVLLYAIGTNEARILIDIPNEIKGDNDAMIEYFKKVTVPQLPQSLQGPLLEALAKGNLRSMPNNALHPSPIKYKGVAVMADAWNMRHPLTGGGMTVALSDVVTLKDLLEKVADLKDKRAIDATLGNFYSQRKPVARTINTLAYSLYNVFRGSADMKDMRDGCMGYFHLGGRCVEDPMSLLSGLESSASLLVVHYFAVALYAVYRLLFPFPTPSKIKRSISMLYTATKVMLSNKKEFITPAY